MKGRFAARFGPSTSLVPIGYPDSLDSGRSWRARPPTWDTRHEIHSRDRQRRVHQRFHPIASASPGSELQGILPRYKNSIACRWDSLWPRQRNHIVVDWRPPKGYFPLSDLSVSEPHASGHTKGFAADIARSAILLAGLRMACDGDKARPIPQRGCAHNGLKRGGPPVPRHLLPNPLTRSPPFPTASPPPSSTGIIDSIRAKCRCLF